MSSLGKTVLAGVEVEHLPFRPEQWKIVPTVVLPHDGPVGVYGGRHVPERVQPAPVEEEFERVDVAAPRVRSPGVEAVDGRIADRGPVAGRDAGDCGRPLRLVRDGRIELTASGGEPAHLVRLGDRSVPDRDPLAGGFGVEGGVPSSRWAGGPVALGSHVQPELPASRTPPAMRSAPLRETINRTVRAVES